MVEKMSRPAALAAALLIPALLSSAGHNVKTGQLLAYADLSSAQGKKSYVCVEVHNPDRILIGAALRSHWRGNPRTLKPLTGKPVLVRYDDEDLWVRAPGRAPGRLHQDYLTRAFPPDSPCEQVVEAAWARLNAPPKTLHVRAHSEP